MKTTFGYRLRAALGLLRFRAATGAFKGFFAHANPTPSRLVRFHPRLAS